MKKPTPEDNERRRRNAEFSRFARENMQRILDEVAASQREREQRRELGFWGRVLRRRPAA
jgi:hypothetical protein